MTKYDLHYFDESQQVLILQFRDEITWEDFHVIIDEAHAKIKTKRHTVDIVLWYKTGRIPPGNPLVQFQSVLKRQPENTGKIVVINPGLNTGFGKYISMIAGIMQRLVPGTESVQLVATYEEACAKLNLILRPSPDE